MMEEKVNQMTEREVGLKEKVSTLSEQIEERDEVIIEMKKRLECEQTD